MRGGFNMAASRIAETYESCDVARKEKLAPMEALFRPVGIISGLIIGTFPLSAPVLYVAALFLFGE